MDGPTTGPAGRDGPGAGEEGPEQVLAGLDPEQREVAQATRGPVCVIAGAGTGKTRAISHRIAYAVRTGAVNPGHVLAVTFTTRAAGELRARLRQLDTAAGGGMGRVVARTFHAAALRQLVHFWPRTVGGRPPAVLDTKIGLLSEAARGLRVRASVAELRDLASEVEWAKVTGVPPDEYPQAAAKAARTPPLSPETTARLYEGYERLLRERHVVDFESVLELTAAILAQHQGAASEVRDRYRYFVVDEYQDVNPLQKLLLDTWCGDRDDVCVVGDPRQTIYSFTGATPAYLTGFTADYPDATVLRLVRNYRSTPQVVELANRLTGSRSGQARGPSGWRGAARGSGGGQAGIPPGLTGIPPGLEPAAGPPLVAQRDSGPPPRFTEHEDEQSETSSVAAHVAALTADGVPPRQIAVLVRTNAQTERFEAALAEAGIACQVRGAERFFGRPEVRQAMGTIKAAAKSAGPGGVNEVRHVLAGLGLTVEPPAGRGAARERWESLTALAQLADDFHAASPEAGLPEFAAELARRAAIEHPPEVEGVTVASLHAAKGLEWDVVFLPGLTEGNLPIIHAETEEAVAEERRLLYVGVTRARRQVLLSWALARSPGGRRTRKPSRFLGGLTPPGPAARSVRAAVAAATAARSGRQPGAAGKAPGIAGRAPGAAEGAPGGAGTGPGTANELGADGQELAERLGAWRLGAAKEAGVPAFVIFTDDTLTRIAGVRPASRAELSAIPGVGAAKLERYGAAVLALCAGTARWDGDMDAGSQA
jgi:ATP-dependent DNA helicase UvrD/PcrA